MKHFNLQGATNEGGGIRTHAYVVLETTALPLGYSPMSSLAFLTISEEIELSRFENQS